MKKTAILLLGMFNFLNAQNHTSVCGFSQQEINTYKCLVESDNINLLNHSDIKKIANEIGISANFTYKSCPNTNNAFAVLNPYSGKRFIGIDTQFFNTSVNSWFKYFLLGHEIGHHLNGHTTIASNNYIEQQEKELESDYFAGYILYKLGATESDLEKYIIPNIPDSNSDYSTHPRKQRRIQATLKGYYNQMNKYLKLVDGISMELSKIYSKIDREKNKNADFDRISEIRKNIHEYEKTGDLSYIRSSKYLLEGLNVKEGDYIGSLRAFIDFTLGDYNSALQFYRNKYYKQPNQENTINYIITLDESNNKDSNIINFSMNSNDPKILLHIHMYLEKLGLLEKSKETIYKAYDIVKYNDNSLLKSDILIHYGRQLYNETLKKKNGNYSLAKLRLLEGKRILEKYPNEGKNYFYYNTLLFHLASISILEENCREAEQSYDLLIKRVRENPNPKNKHYLYTPYSLLANCYLKNDEIDKSISMISNAIANSEGKNMADFLNFRAGLYLLHNKQQLAYDDYKKACNMGNNESCDMIKKAHY